MPTIAIANKIASEKILSEKNIEIFPHRSAREERASCSAGHLPSRTASSLFRDFSSEALCWHCRHTDSARERPHPTTGMATSTQPPLPWRHRGQNQGSRPVSPGGTRGAQRPQATSPKFLSTDGLGGSHRPCKGSPRSSGTQAMSGPVWGLRAGPGGLWRGADDTTEDVSQWGGCF